MQDMLARTEDLAEAGHVLGRHPSDTSGRAHPIRELLSLGMLMFGGCTILGNLAGGHAADRFEINRSLMIALTLLAGNLGLLYLFRRSPLAVPALIGGLGGLFRHRNALHPAYSAPVQATCTERQ